MKCNLNDRVRARLTETGAKHYNEADQGVPEKYRRAPLKAGDEVSMPLWEAMQIFGGRDRIFLGGEAPFDCCAFELGKQT
ncbi:hypothetical protein [Cupriavidus metallidurans]|uniref:hypothetical protein n=1 Tax=Cupriavidus metallidurans TaxID=119219 RepID=UPI001CCE6243|nr:hypothetical protein [Cupriavidus metallidurans]UBM12825.1 hypothetical protein LAI70_28130 [Cupriavidus metallidurans]